MLRHAQLRAHGVGLGLADSEVEQTVDCVGETQQRERLGVGRLERAVHDAGEEEDPHAPVLHEGEDQRVVGGRALEVRKRHAVRRLPRNR